MPKGKKLDFRADGFEPPKGEKVIITISKAKGYTQVAPSTRINVYGLSQDRVLAFITGALAYSIARHGSLDASNWEDTQKESKNG